MIARFLALPVHAWRLFFSPILPAACRFHPSCSAYALEALERHGAWRGLWLTLRRLGRCHPFHEGGVDPVPPARVTSACPHEESKQWTATSG